MIAGLLARLGWWEVLQTPGPRRMLAVNALVDSAGLGLAAVCLPFFVLKGLDLSPAQFALAITVAGTAELLATVPAGAIAGRVGIHRYSVATRGLRAIILALLAWSGNFAVLLVLLVLLGACRAATFGLSQSLTAAVVGEQDRGSVMAVNRALRNIGYLVSASIGAVVVSLDNDLALRLALGANALSYAVSAALVFRLRPLRPPRPPERLDWSVLRDHRYLALSGLGGVFASTILILDFALPLWVVQEQLPPWIVGVVVALNTTLVVALQVRFSKQAETIRGSLVLLRISTLFFALTAAAFALSHNALGVPATVAVITAGLLMTIAELAEGPAWWTLSFELAAYDRVDEYLAAFDLNEGILNIVGPMLMLLAVGYGSFGWLAYGVVVVLSLVAVHRVVASIGRERPTVSSLAEQP